MANSSMPGPRVPLVDENGLIQADWYRWFASKERDASAAVAGEVQGGAGLSGGGPVSQGVTLSVGANGVANAMLRQSLALSIIGRFQNSAGNVADIQAVANDRVLMRAGDQLVFRPVKLASYTVAGAPGAGALGAGTLIYVSDEAGGAAPAFSDGTDWRRVTDRAIIS